MIPQQDLWWQQARSDHSAFLVLRRHQADPCHLLHYLQMSTEKLAKAYFWRTGTPPPRSHAGFGRLMRSLGSRLQPRRQAIAEALRFASFGQLQGWTQLSLPLIYALEGLAPALAQDGPNPEYPWPQAAPTETPALYLFPVWIELTETGRGRQLLQVIHSAIDQFPVYA